MWYLHTQNDNVLVLNLVRCTDNAALTAVGIDALWWGILAQRATFTFCINIEVHGNTIDKYLE